GQERFVAQRMDAAVVAQRRGDVPTMVKELRQVLKVKPQHPEALRRVQNRFASPQLAYVLGQWREAAALWEQIGLARLSMGEAFLFADACHRSGDVRRAEAIYTDLVRRYPHEPEVYNALGYFYAERGIKLDEAVRLTQQSLAMIPAHDRQRRGMVTDSLGWAYYKQGKLDVALTTIQEASDLLASRDPEVLYHLGVVYRALKRRDDARRALTRALFVLPRDLRPLALRQSLERDIRAELERLGVAPPPAPSPPSGWREFIRQLIRALAAVR
ncbi:MAG: tetratricopeptide repeat protein, partial [Abditibacteriales bacterium]|nr:tetratricopeptide repeat protein [Abditibacteriales bacterium]MDW8368331.1 tetratricopeptide repeat protein [Abditibacteriales bacterium]